MKVGFVLPQIGPLGTPENILKTAERAEALQYDSLWVTERLLYPLNPQTPYPVTRDGSLPETYKHCLDPLETLTFVAGRTKRVGLGTSVLDLPYYNPVMLARSLTTLDVLSGGRLRVGFGQGWSKDEFDAVGATFDHRAGRADEFLQVLKAIWTTDPCEFHGKYFQLPKSIINPKPVQKPHPPILLAAYAEGSLRRIARLADGWNPAEVPLEGMAVMMESLRKMATEAGRDPSSIQLVVRANLVVTAEPIEKKRGIFKGSLDQIREDAEGCRKLGAREIFFDPVATPGAQDMGQYLSWMEKLRGVV